MRADTVAGPSSPRARHSEGLTDTNIRQPRHSPDLDTEPRKPLPAEAEGAERNNHNQIRPRQRLRKCGDRQIVSFL